MNRFENYENFEDRSELYEKIAYILYAKKYYAIKNEDEKQLLSFLKDASQEEKEEVEQLAKIIEKYNIYINTDTKYEEIEQIEAEMEKNFRMKDYIERHYAEVLAKDYFVWIETLRNYEKIKKEKDRPYEERRKELEAKNIVITKSDEERLRQSAESVLNVFSLTKREIQKLLEFVGKYPKEMKEALSSASLVALSRYTGIAEINKTNSDLSKAYTEFNFLKGIKNYLDGKMSEKDQSDFFNLIIEDKNNREVFTKISDALKT